MKMSALGAHIDVDKATQQSSSGQRIIVNEIEGYVVHQPETIFELEYFDHSWRRYE